MGAAHHTLPTDPIDRALARAHGVLPDQGPIGVFVHHNTLHAFQHLPFHEGVQAGAEALAAEPYLRLSAFREALGRGRIADADVRHEIGRALGDRAGDAVWPALTRAELWHTLLTAPLEFDDRDAAGLAFTTRAGTAVECDDLPRWQACLARVDRGPAPPPVREAAPRRHRDVLVAIGTDDPDVPVHAELIRLGAGFLDHGHAPTPLPARTRGFLAAVASLYAAGAREPRLCPGVADDLRAVAARGVTARAVIEASLAALGVSGDDVEPWLFATALALPGWAGMFARLERHPEDHPGGPPSTLAEFLAVRLVLERRALGRAATGAGVPLAWPDLRTRMAASRPVPRVVAAQWLWHVSRAAGLSAEAVAQLDAAPLARLWDEIEACSDVWRRRVLHEAYERTYRRQILDALAARRTLPSPPLASRARAQFVFCIDEREESIRRAVEEQHPGYLTYGAAGFFGVAIDYQGLYDREPAAYCPVVVIFFNDLE